MNTFNGMFQTFYELWRVEIKLRAKIISSILCSE